MFTFKENVICFVAGLAIMVCATYGIACFLELTARVVVAS